MPLRRAIGTTFIAVVAMAIIAMATVAFVMLVSQPGVSMTTSTSSSSSASSFTTTTSTSTLHTSSSSTQSVPPPSTTVIDYGCDVLGPSSPGLILVNSSGVGVKLNMSISPSAPIEETACSYTFTNTTTPTACGVMCGGGIGYTYQYSYVLKLNFSLSSTGGAVGQNLTISQGSGLSSVFPLRGNQVSLDSQQVTWYSSPPCYGGNGIESDCISHTATAMTIELPASIGSGTLQLVVSSGEYLVP